MTAAALQILAAPDSFKGTFRATEVAAAMGRGIEAAGGRPDLCPIADGGEGTMEVLLTVLGGETAGATVHDPLGREVKAGFGLLEDGGTAIVEVAQASGLNLVAEDERDAEAASSAGTGELILAAVEAGAAVVLVAVGRQRDHRRRRGRDRGDRGGRRPARRAACRAERHAHAVRARGRGLRAAEGRGPRGGEAPDQAAARAG